MYICMDINIVLLRCTHRPGFVLVLQYVQAYNNKPSEWKAFSVFQYLICSPFSTVILALVQL